MRLLGRFLSLLGIPLAALSVISLIRRIAKLELQGIYADFVNFYQSISHAAVSFIPTELLNVQIPPIVKDYWTLSFWLTGIQVLAMSRAAPDVRSRLPIAEWLGKTAMILFLGYSFIGLFMGLSVIGSSLFMDKQAVARFSDERVNLLGYMVWLRRWFVVSILAVIVFFGLNAYAPGL